MKGEGAALHLVAPPRLVGLLPLLAAPSVLQAGGLQLLRPAGPVCGTAPAPSHPLSFPRAAGSSSCGGQGMEEASGAISCLCVCQCQHLPGRPGVQALPSAGGAAPSAPVLTLGLGRECRARPWHMAAVTRVSLSGALREIPAPALPDGSNPPRGLAASSPLRELLGPGGTFLPVEALQEQTAPWRPQCWAVPGRCCLLNPSGARLPASSPGSCGEEVTAAGPRKAPGTALGQLPARGDGAGLLRGLGEGQGALGAQG